jgi:ribosomal protein S18 acetylase RimI-like enzyme
MHKSSRDRVISSHAPAVIEPLGAKHDKLRVAFSCGEESLDRYLKQQAGQDAKKRVAAPYVMVWEGRIAGFYTLSASSVRVDDLPSEERQKLKLPRYPVVGVTLIGRLARDLTFRRQGIGEMLLIDALQRSFVNSATVASMAVVVDSKNDTAYKFYSSFGFISFSDTRERLFLPMNTIRHLFKL